MSNRIDQINQWPRVNFRRIIEQLHEAHQEGKWLFVWDRQGMVASYFRYQGILCDLDAEVVKHELGRTNTADVLQFFRKAIIESQSEGRSLLINLE